MERIYIYKNSRVNFFSPSGPAALSMFMPKTKTIIFNFSIGGIDSNEDYYKKELGLDYGEQPFLPLGGYVSWTKNNKRSNLNNFKLAYYEIEKYISDRNS